MANNYNLRRLSIAVFTAFLSVTASHAYDFEVDGIYYNITSKTYLEVEVTYGTYANYSGDVVIPDTVNYDGSTYNVTSIGDYAFEDCQDLTSVEIPNSVTSIGDYAFVFTNLTSVDIPNSVTSIGYWAFFWCEGLKSVEIPNSVINIGYGAFAYCDSLTSIEVDEENEYYCSSDGVLYDKNMNTLICYSSGKTDESYTIPETVTIIDIYAFYGCDNLTSVEISNSVISIGNYAFYGCDNLTSVEIPNSVISIGDFAFSYCDKLTSVDIPNSVTSIGSGAFTSCSSLTSIEIPNSVTNIGYSVFFSCSALTSIEVDEENEYYCSSDGVLFDKDFDTLKCYPAGKTDKSYTVPETVTIIEVFAFAYCDGLSSVEIPNSVTIIGESSFHYCTSLTNVEIPDGVTIIEYGTFYFCTSLMSVEIPSRVTSIGNYAFYNCSALTDVYSLNVTPPTCKSKSFSTYEDATLYVPSSAVEDYESADVWCEFAKIVGLETSYTVGITVSEEVVSIGESITLIATIEDFETDYLYTDTVYVWYVSVDDGEAEEIGDSTGNTLVYAPTAAGTYSFYCSVTINDVTINSDKSVVLVAETETDDDAGISDITPDETGEYSVYSLGGVLLMKTKDSSEIEGLPEGIYIVNGKKMAIKR